MWEGLDGVVVKKDAKLDVEVQVEFEADEMFESCKGTKAMDDNSSWKKGTSNVEGVTPVEPGQRSFPGLALIPQTVLSCKVEHQVKSGYHFP
jgi:hypothetical protein